MSDINKYFETDDRDGSLKLKPILKNDLDRQDRFKIKHPEGYDFNEIKSSIFDTSIRKHTENLISYLIERGNPLVISLVFKFLTLLQLINLRYLLFTDNFLFLELKHSLILNYRKKDTSLNLIFYTRTKNLTYVLDELCKRNRWDLILKAYDTYLQFRKEDANDYEDSEKVETVDD